MRVASFSQDQLALNIDLVVLLNISLASGLFDLSIHFTLASFSLELAKVKLRFSLIHTLETSTKPEDSTREFTQNDSNVDSIFAKLTNNTSHSTLDKLQQI